MTITYETAKLIKDFLKDSAPEPIEKEYYDDIPVNTGVIYVPDNDDPDMVPAYSLEDLLSRPFCEGMGKAVQNDYPKKHPGYHMAFPPDWEETFDDIVEAWKDGGLPAVESALVKMMGKK